MAFFDAFARFQATSSVGASPNRLNARYAAIVDRNREIFAAARVLDLASHDGRWSFAALHAGAAHVTGVEARADLVEAAEKTFAAYGVGPDRYRFVVGTLPDALAASPVRADVVLLLGFLYHTARHAELVAAVAATGARHVIVDTCVCGDAAPPAPIVELRRESVAYPANQAVADAGNGGEAVVAYPSRRAVQFLFDGVGYDTEEIDWAPVLRDVPAAPRDDVADYRDGSRTTFRMTRRSPAS